MSLFQSLLASTSAGVHSLEKFSVKYRTTDFAYLTSAPYSDMASFNSGSNVIRVETVVTPDTNACTTPVYMYADDPDNDRIFFRSIDAGLIVVDRDWNVITGFGGSQASCYDPTTDEIYSFTGGGTNGCTVRDGTTGTTKRFYNTTFGAGSGHVYYDYENLKFYMSPDVAQVQIWGFSGSDILLEETLWFSSRDGLVVDKIFDKIINYDPSDTKRIRYQDLSGTTGLKIYSAPITLNSEGIAVCPDGTTILADPSGYHFGVVNGNRLLWHDNRSLYKKYDRSPSMTRFTRFSGGVVSGRFDTQKMFVGIGDKIYSPVYDTDGFTNTENASAWEFEFSEEADADITFRGSATAPTTTPKTQYDSDLPTYAGWGATSPSAEQGTPGTFRYKQAVLTVKAATPSSLITPQDLVDAIQPELLFLCHREEYLYVCNDVSPTQIPVIPNQSNPDVFLSQATANQRLAFNAALSFVDDQNQNAHEQLNTISHIITNTQGQLTVFGCRSATNTVALFMNVGTSGSNANRFLFRWDTSTSGSRINIEEWGSGGTLVNKVGTPADTSTNIFKKIDLICNGTTKSIKVNDVNQTITVVNGSNNGNWFNSLASPANRIQVGFANGLAATIWKTKFLLYKSTPLTTDMNNLITAYGNQEGLYG